MTKQFFKDSLAWGFALWIFGYLLGFIFFAFIPQKLLGWVIMPFGIIVTLWVLFKKINAEKLSYYFWLAVIWTAIAIVFDYFFLVKILKPADGYYKLDVYLYYVLTFAIPLLVGWRKKVFVKQL